jgi:hypothetical protein
LPLVEVRALPTLDQSQEQVIMDFSLIKQDKSESLGVLRDPQLLFNDELL